MLGGLGGDNYYDGGCREISRCWVLGTRRPRGEYQGTCQTPGVCDVIAAPQRSIDLLLEWLRGKRVRNFVVTLKFKGHDEYPLLEILKRDAPPLCAEFHLTRLCANKNEVCAFGVV
jgi:hypothetical protein